MPSPDTLADILAIIKKEELIRLLPDLLKYVIDNGINNLEIEDDPIFQDEEIIIEDIYNFDGKEIIKTGYNDITGRVDEDLINYNSVNVVSTRYGIALDLERIPKKNNEITKIPELINKLNIKNCICTADAINTQTRVVDAIVSQKGYYVLALKKNQPGTYDDWLLYFDTYEFLAKIKDTPNGYYETERKTTYYTYKTQYYITENIEWFEEKKWRDLKSVGYVVTEKTDKKTKEVTIEKRYFICNIKANAYLFAMAVRNHWGVEVMHWYLDVSFEEDRTRIRNKNVLENLTIINRFVLSILTLVKPILFPKKSIRGVRNMIAMRFEERISKVLQVLSYFQKL